MSDFDKMVLDIRLRMVRLNLKQLDIVNFLIESDDYKEYNRESLKTNISLALNGKRQGKRYQTLLSDINGVLDNYESELSLTV